MLLKFLKCRLRQLRESLVHNTRPPPTPHSPLGTVVEISEDWLGTPHKQLKELLKTNTCERVHNEPSLSINSYFKSKYLNGRNAFVSWIAEFKKEKEPVPLLGKKQFSFWKRFHSLELSDAYFRLNCLLIKLK